MQTNLRNTHYSVLLEMLACYLTLLYSLVLYYHRNLSYSKICYFNKNSKTYGQISES